MQVKLISHTDSIEMGRNYMTPEQLIVNIARVSNPSNQNNHETADKLIGYLIKNKHWSPFEMVDMTVEIKTSRAIAQQILRHRSFSFQEFSQRYAEVVDMEPIELRKQGETNRQGGEEQFDPKLGINKDQSASSCIEWHIGQSEYLYKQLIDAGVAKECARFVLPLTTQTTIYMKGCARSWIHYLQQRCDAHAQKEHREVANEIRVLFVKLFPNTGKALGWL